MLITAPTDEERVFDLAVRVARAEIRKNYVRASITPWIKIRANLETERITIACGLKARRLTPQIEDGA